jgi:glutamate synthase domain-containing protein 3
LACAHLAKKAKKKTKLKALVTQDNDIVLGGCQMKTREKNDRCFSIELNSKHHIKNITMSEGKKENTLIEGTIGNLIGATFTEGIILEVTGTKGTLRLDLQAKEITQKATNQ